MGKDLIGFIVYRTDYRDEEQWNRFMTFLNNQAHIGLIDNGESKMIPALDWNVQSDPELQGAGPAEVRERFNAWLDSGEEETRDDTYRYLACVLVDSASLDAVDCFMENKTYEDNRRGLFDRWGTVSVWLVSRYEEDGEFMVGVSYLFPGTAYLIQMDNDDGGTGWDAVKTPLGQVALPD